MDKEKTAEEYLYQGCVWNHASDTLHSIVHEAIEQGCIWDAEEQRMLKAAIELMGKMGEFAFFRMSQFEAKKDANNSSFH